PAMCSAKEKARRAFCLSNMRQLTIGTHIYSEDDQGKIPEGHRSNDGGHGTDDYTGDVHPAIGQYWTNTYGEKVIDCPNFYPFQTNRYEIICVAIGYHFLGGRSSTEESPWG